jgi:hypothetical protein
MQELCWKELGQVSSFSPITDGIFVLQDNFQYAWQIVFASGISEFWQSLSFLSEKISSESERDIQTESLSQLT